MASHIRVCEPQLAIVWSRDYTAKWTADLLPQLTVSPYLIDEMFPEDAVLHDGRAEYRGPTEFERFYDALRAQLSEVRVWLANCHFACRRACNIVAFCPRV